MRGRILMRDRNFDLCCFMAALSLIWSAGCRPSTGPLPPTRPNATAISDVTSDLQEPSFSETGHREDRAEMGVKMTTLIETTEDGTKIFLYTCTNAHGLVFKAMTYGATVTEIQVPDRAGNLANVTLGFPSLRGYLARHPYFGSTVGRYCNRIAKGTFTLDGRQYELATNNDANHLHGGQVGYDAVVWDAEPVQSADEVGIKFTYLSKDGEEGYPGNLNVTAIYTLNNDNELTVELTASTDQRTPVNLTNHCYWNLAGAGSILDHELMITADHYVEVDDKLIPTGNIPPVEGTPLDFTSPESIGARIDQLKGNPDGYDHCYVLRGQDGSLALAARVKDPSTGRVLEIHTTEPGIQFYSGNFLDGSDAGGGFNKRDGFCLETQHYPDSPNQPDFPSTILEPGESYRHVTVHKFYTE